MLQVIANIIGYVLLYAVFLFVPAGTLHWWRAWVFLAVMLAVRVVSTVSVARVNKSLLRERARFPLQPGQPLADRALLISFMAATGALVAFIALDVFRLHLLARPHFTVSLDGMLLFIGGNWIITTVLRTNAFATTVVRHQSERQHVVVTSGIYGIVRHPFYAGLIPTELGMCLWLQSYAAALLAIVPLGIIVVRIVLEERFLKRQLPGYAAYATRVRYRLIPGVW